MREETQSQNPISRVILIILALLLISLAFIGRRANLIGFEEVGGMQLALLGFGTMLLGVAVFKERMLRMYQVIAVFLLNTLLLVLIIELVVIFSLNLQFVTNNQVRVPEAGNVPYFADQSWGQTVWVEHEAVLANANYHPYIMWEQPSFAGEVINIDENGRRFVPDTACVNPDAYTIFIYGGSTLWGMGVPDWGTIPAYLQAQLANDIEQPLCVINHGEIAYVSTQEILSLMLEVREGNVPDLVIFYNGINDTISAFNTGEAGNPRSPDDFSRAFESRETRSPLLVWLGNTYTVRLITALSQPTDQTSAGDTPAQRSEQELTDNILSVYESNYRIAQSLAEDRGFDFMFIWQPTLVVGEKVMTQDETIASAAPPAALRSLYQSVWMEAERRATNLSNMIYMGDIFDGVETYAYYDHVHLVPEGNAIVADAIADLIISEQIIR